MNYLRALPNHNSEVYTINVAKGTYKYNAAHDVTGFPTQRNSVVVSDLNVVIRGGYDGTNWAAAPNGVTNPTKIDAESTQGLRGVLVVRRVRADGQPLDGATALEMRDFTITRVWATPLPTNYVFPNGAASAPQVYQEYAASLPYNGFGGGMDVEFGIVNLVNVTFANNFAAGGSGSGGAKSRGGVGAAGGLALNFSGTPPGVAGDAYAKSSPSRLSS